MSTLLMERRLGNLSRERHASAWQELEGEAPRLVRLRRVPRGKRLDNHPAGYANPYGRVSASPAKSTAIPATFCTIIFAANHISFPS
ncbi:MAG: hypothetical protein RLZZ303_401 [Candidatus Hydrogenedentota bacterium]